MTYQGWENYRTWNVALWMQNTEASYLTLVHFMKDYQGSQPYLDYVSHYGMESDTTGDNVAYMHPTINYEELNSMMWEFSPQGTRA